MRAIMLREFGSAENLKLEELPAPVDEPGWVTIELRASALNWHDVLLRQGKYGSVLPNVPGADGAGIRVDTGEEVMIMPSLWWGDDDSFPGESWEILGDQRPGTYAEAVRVPTECVVPKPRGYSWAQASAFSLTGLTTFRALFTKAGLRAGESLLVLGAGGGIATTAVALAAGIGAAVVVTSSSERKIELARGIGARDGVLYTESGWVDAARKVMPGGFDVVLDSVGSWQESLRALKPGGRLVVMGASTAEEVPIGVRQFYYGQYSLLGTTMGGPRDFAGLLAMLDEHKITPPVIDRLFALDDVVAAHEYLEQGGVFGKVVLEHQ